MGKNYQACHGDIERFNTSSTPSPGSMFLLGVVVYLIRRLKCSGKEKGEREMHALLAWRRKGYAG
jgi:hypothetical protein